MTRQICSTVTSPIAWAFSLADLFDYMVSECRLISKAGDFTQPSNKAADLYTSPTLAFSLELIVRGVLKGHHGCGECCATAEL